MSYEIRRDLKINGCAKERESEKVRERESGKARERRQHLKKSVELTNSKNCLIREIFAGVCNS
jgi:hypothetical protein